MTKQLINEINALPAEAQRQIADFAEFLRQKYQTAPEVKPTKTMDIDNDPFIGMWSDRKDLADSSRAVREMHRTERGDN